MVVQTKRTYIMLRTPIDIVLNDGVYAIEVHEGTTPWSTNDPWLAMSMAVALTGASWRGHGSLKPDETQEIQAWCRNQKLLPRAEGRVVEVRRRDTNIDFLVDNAVVASVLCSDMQSNRWWHKPLRAIMSNASLDYPIDLIEIDFQTGHRTRLAPY